MSDSDSDYDHPQAVKSRNEKRRQSENNWGKEDTWFDDSKDKVKNNYIIMVFALTF